jgi:6,7-dimethyl-8-ribityllumazine synthase
VEGAVAGATVTGTAAGMKLSEEELAEELAICRAHVDALISLGCRMQGKGFGTKHYDAVMWAIATAVREAENLEEVRKAENLEAPT